MSKYLSRLRHYSHLHWQFLSDKRLVNQSVVGLSDPMNGITLVPNFFIFYPALAALRGPEVADHFC
jgi:hypothetical protein